MTALQNKIDFAIVYRVKNANPNGDPLNGNRPRTDYGGFGEMTDVCQKRKIRDRLQEDGICIFVQSDEKKTDGMPSLRARAESKEFGLGADAFTFKKGDKNVNAKKDETARKACQKWFDVRAFGQVFAFGKQEDADGVSIPIRGPVTIQSAFSVERISVTSNQITKSVAGETNSDRMGMKHRVDARVDGLGFVYVTYGSISPQLADKTGFSAEDAATLKAMLPKIFENDASSARPDGSMEVLKVIWWQHDSKTGKCSSAKVHRSLTVSPTGEITLTDIGVKPEIIEGF
jgi:CRISPR-associated protein Csd2